MKLIIIFLALSLNTFAAELKIEPVYGVERTQRFYPEPARYKTQTFLGVRAVYGSPDFAFEFELNQSNDSEDFPDSNSSAKYQNQKALLGFRTYPLKSKYLGAYLRFGIQANKQTETITTDGTTTTEEYPINIDPYAGVGLTLAFGNNFALNAGATLVYNKNAEEAEKYDTRYTFSFTIKAGNR